MSKLYSKKSLATTKFLPKPETINFILNYSKSMSVMKVGKMNFEFNAN